MTWQQECPAGSFLTFLLLGINKKINKDRKNIVEREIPGKVGRIKAYVLTSMDIPFAIENVRVLTFRFLNIRFLN